MLLTTQLVDDGLAIVSVSRDLVHASSLRKLTEACENLNQRGRRGILIDMARVRRMNMSGLAAVVELVARHPKWDIGLCALPAKIARMVSQSGLDRGLPIFPDVETACKAPEFRGRSLCGTRAVLLCADRGRRAAPLTDVTPTPMLDVVGRPILHRIMDHLAGFGLRDVILNPGHHGDQVVEYVRAHAWPDHRIQFANEGSFHQGQWRGDPIGTASTLKRLQVTSSAFSSDLVVLCGDALVDIDMAEMMRQHRQSGAAVTIAVQSIAPEQGHGYGVIETSVGGRITGFAEKPRLGLAENQLVNTGIYIMKPEVLDLVSDSIGLDIATDLLPAVMAARMNMQVFSRPFQWIDIGCSQDYARATALCLSGELPFARPLGLEIRPNVWALPGAEVAADARIDGPCHIGANAVISAKAHLSGGCVIGAGAEVEGKTLLKDCIVLPETRVCEGAWSDHKILSGAWAMDRNQAFNPVLDNSIGDHVTPRQDMRQPAPELRKSA